MRKWRSRDYQKEILQYGKLIEEARKRDWRRLADPWLLSVGIAYDTSMVDDKDRTPDLPIGEQWRFGLGARYDWSQQLAFGLAYELLWGGNLDMDLNGGPLAGRVEGSYDDAAIHFISFNVNWKF